MIKQFKYTYFRDKSNKCASNPKLRWRTLNEISGKSIQKKEIPLNSLTLIDETNKPRA